MLGYKTLRCSMLDAPMLAAPMALLGLTAQTPKLSTTESNLWHQRLGHLHIAAMKPLVDGYTHDGSICELCIQAKHERKVIRTPVQRTTTPFELVHSDTCGPLATKSVGGASHFIVFIDDYTRYTTVYFLENKRSGTCVSVFQHFQAKLDSWGVRHQEVQM